MIHIFGGGTISHIRNHLAICAPAYGATANKLFNLFWDYGMSVELHLTKMADKKSKLETNEDIANKIDELLGHRSTKAIVMNAALCDYDGFVLSDGVQTKSGKYAERLKTNLGRQNVLFVPATKVIGGIKAKRPDVFVVGFKTTAGATEFDQVVAASKLFGCCDIVVANDTINRSTIICEGIDNSFPYGNRREDALECLVSRVSDAITNIR